MNLSAFSSMLLSIWKYIKPAVYGWLTIIAVIVVFLIIFRCYRSPLSIAKDRLKKLQSVLARLSARKKAPSRKKIRDIHITLLRSGRLIQAYLYDHPAETAASEAFHLVTSADRAVSALSLDKLQKNVQASNKVLKNAAALIKKAIDSIMESQ